MTRFRKKTISKIRRNIFRSNFGALYDILDDVVDAFGIICGADSVGVGADEFVVDEQKPNLNSDVGSGGGFGIFENWNIVGDLNVVGLVIV